MDMPLTARGVYRFDRYRLDLLRRTLWRDETAIPLQPRPFEALAYIVTHHDRVVTRGELFAALWPGRVVEDNNLGQAISTLRRILQAEAGAESLILTVPGRGYRMGVPVTLEIAPDAQHGPATHALPPFARTRDPAWVLTTGLLVTLACLVVFIAWRRPEPAAAPAFDPPPYALAVLAFANMSGDPTDSYFSDGVADQLINTLSQIEPLEVAARTSAFSFKDGHATIGEIARRLNVASVLEGAVRRDSRHLHIDVQLIDARSGFQIWSRGYDRDRVSGDMLALQSDIATTVAGALKIKLLETDDPGRTLGGTRSAAAFDAYLRGMDEALPVDDAHDQKALAAFTEAIRLDPAYADAYAGRANVLQRYGQSHGGERQAQCRYHEQRCRRLGRDHAPNHAQALSEPTTAGLAQRPAREQQCQPDADAGLAAALGVHEKGQEQQVTHAGRRIAGADREQQAEPAPIMPCGLVPAWCGRHAHLPWHECQHRERDCQADDGHARQYGAPGDKRQQ
jgi:TolB-like protein/DNA-binding winged helix-turn-helix (wHTH) protein